MPGNVTITTANPPQGTCPSWIITLWPQLAALLTANLNGSYNVFNYGNSTPAPADQGKPWKRLNSDGSPDKDYVFFSGLWVSGHTLLPGTRIIAPSSITTAAQLWAWDGGDGSNPASTTPTGAVGAMWEVDSDLDAKFPLGIGTLPSTALVSVGDSGGEENHVLTVGEMAAHHHNVQVDYADVGGGSAVRRLIANAATTMPEAVTDDSGSGTAHNNMPPWRGVMFIRRTNRIFYTP